MRRRKIQRERQEAERLAPPPHLRAPRDPLLEKWRRLHWKQAEQRALKLYPELENWENVKAFLEAEYG